MVDTSAIHALIARARFRLRLQAAMEGATLGAVFAFPVALAVVFAYRMGWVDAVPALIGIAAAAALVPAGAAVAALRRVSDHVIAQRLDRASDLADRIGTACAFEAALARREHAVDVAAHDPETLAMMEAAVRDAVRAAPRANLIAATPYRAPADWPAAAIAAVICAAVALLWWPGQERDQLDVSGNVTLDGKLLPDEAKGRGTLIIASAGDAEGTETRLDLGTTGPFRYDIDLARGSYRVEFEPSEALCADGNPHAMPCLPGNVIPVLTLGPDARAQDARTKVPAFLLECSEGVCSLDIDIKSAVGRPEAAVAFEEEDSDYVRELLQDLRRTAEADRDPTLLEFANKIEELLTKSERGELTKEELLEELAEAENEFKQEDAKVEEALKDLKELGKELEKEKLTQELGKALEKGEMEKAKAEMEKLADKLENEKLSEKDRQKVADAMEKATDKLDKKEQKREQDDQKAVEQKKEAIKKLQKQLDQAKDQQQKDKLSRRLEKEKRELKKLERNKEQREQSQAKRNLKQLRRDMKQAAEQMRSKNQEQRRQAAQKMRDAAKQSGKVEQDARKTATQKKVASQLDDLREAMQRAKQRGNRGPKDMFGKNKRNSDFARRAKGGQGSRQAWKPGQQGTGNCPGGNCNNPGHGHKPGGKGQQPGGSSWGTEHDPNLMGDPTAKQGGTEDESVQGVQGREGESTRETILAAAQKGFATRSYKRVYAAYKTIVEEVMSSEKVPSGYKYYVKRYFQKIKPHTMD